MGQEFSISMDSSQVNVIPRERHQGTKYKCTADAHECDHVQFLKENALGVDNELLEHAQTKRGKHAVVDPAPRSSAAHISS